MTIPESTVATVRAVLQHYAAITVDDMGIRASHALTALDSTPPPAMGGLPEGCPTELRWHRDGTFRKVDPNAPHLPTTVEVVAQGTRSRMERLEALRIYVENPSAWDHFSQNVSDAIAAILRDGKESKPS